MQSLGAFEHCHCRGNCLDPGKNKNWNWEAGAKQASLWGENKLAQAFFSTGVPGKSKKQQAGTQSSPRSWSQPLWKEARMLQKGGGLRSSVMYMFKENQAAASTLVLDACVSWQKAHDAELWGMGWPEPSWSGLSSAAVLTQVSWEADTQTRLDMQRFIR